MIRYVLVACEESQRVCSAFREKGIQAYSCDLQKCSGGHPEWHIHSNVLPLISTGEHFFITSDGVGHVVPGWDLLIAHPPCTYLSAVTAPLISHCGSIDWERFSKMQKASEFFYLFLNSDLPRVCIENPRPLKAARLPEASQVIEPWFFGDPYTKRTYLWLKGLPPLFSTDIVVPGYSYTASCHGSVARSKTHPGIASAMANQWSIL